jgi:hypothetical protein
MNQEIVESIHHAVVPGECVDLYYPGEENCHKQCFASIQDNRYVLDLPSKSSGSSNTLLFNPDQGLSDIILTFQLPSGTYTNLYLPEAWGYSMIKNVALRVGGSSLYYFTGDQMFVDVMTDCEDTGKRNQMALLGGQPCLVQNDFNDVNKRTAYVYLKMPFNTPSAQEKTLPLPTDLLTQPVQIIVEFKDFSQVFVAGSSPSAIPTQLAVAQACFKQIHLHDQGQLLARRENMNEKALSYPLRYFPQTTFKTTVAATAGQDVQINLTGFRSGSLKEIVIWAVNTDDLAGGNPFNFELMSNVRLLVNGLVYYDARNASNQIWSLVEKKTSASVDLSIVDSTGTASDVSAPWVVVPFAQHTEQLAGENELASGLAIMNSVVNLSLQLPSTANYVIACEYRYGSTLMFSKGSAEYIF